MFPSSIAYVFLMIFLLKILLYILCKLTVTKDFTQFYYIQLIDWWLFTYVNINFNSLSLMKAEYGRNVWFAIC